MPKTSRPISSLFWQIVKSAVFDTSLKRLTSSDAGKNIPIVFSYFTRISFETLVLNPFESGKTGKEILDKEEGTTVEHYLKEAGFKDTHYSRTVVRRVFDLFVRDKALEVKTKNGERYYRLIGEIPKIEEDELERILQTNRYLVYAGEDLIPMLPKSLIAGEAIIDKGDREYSLVVEAMLQDFVFHASRKEATFYIIKDSYKFRNPDEIVILSLYEGAGHALVHFTEYLLQTYNEKIIKIYGCDTSPINIARARINLRSLQIDFRSTNRSSAINIEERFILVNDYEEWYLRFGNIMDKVDILLIPPIFNNFTEEEAKRFVKRTSEMIHKDGVVIIFQSTAYAEDFPLPLYPLSANFKGFYDTPTKQTLRKILSNSFGKVKTHLMESLWIAKKPKR